MSLFLRHFITNTIITMMMIIIIIMVQEIGRRITLVTKDSRESIVVPAPVHCPSTGKYGLLPQYVHCHRIITHCTRFLFNFHLLTGFVLVGIKIIIIIIMCQQPYLCSSCHRVSQNLEPPSSGISAGAGSTNESRHWRHQGSNLPVPADVSGPPTGQCGLLPQHFHHRVNAVVVLLA